MVCNANLVNATAFAFVELRANEPSIEPTCLRLMSNVKPTNHEQTKQMAQVFVSHVGRTPGSLWRSPPA